LEILNRAKRNIISIIRARVWSAGRELADGKAGGRSPTLSWVASLGGDFLRATREQQGISQEELARRVGTHQPQISAWETGRKPIQVEHLATLLRALGLDLSLDAVPHREQ
jgi:ribosome-binding protein aMBF1 (putative translation factor)